MRIGITGTYSSGKTLTSLAASNFLGIKRTEARTMREILPEVAPGKALEQVSSPELIQMILIRHTERVLHENILSPEFISDGCSLQEWIYGSVRIKYGINPNESINLKEGESVNKSAEIEYFEKIMNEIGKMYKRHVAKSFDVFIHLPNELPLAKDGHRPVNELFRSASDRLLKETIAEIGVKCFIIGGTLEDRLVNIANTIGKEPVTSVEKAIDRAQDEYKKIIM